MGVAHSKREAEEEHITARGVGKQNQNCQSFKEKGESHRALASSTRHTMMRLQDRSAADDYLEKKEIAEETTEPDLKHSLSTMINSMVLIDRRYARAAVHPTHQEPPSPSHTRPIVESLPPPVHERDERRGSSSLPVRCPSSRRQRNGDTAMNSISEADDSEYLSKLYDLRTWNMYRLITESRRKNPAYIPTIREDNHVDDYEDAAAAAIDGEESASFTSNMIFAFDL